MLVEVVVVPPETFVEVEPEFSSDDPSSSPELAGEDPPVNSCSKEVSETG